MGRECATSPFPDACVANPREVRGWQREEGECCTVEDFRLDLTKGYGSEWNKSAINVFVEDFIETGTYSCTDAKQVRRTINRHFRTIRRQYDIWKADREAAAKGTTVNRKDVNKERAKTQRRYNTYQRRLRIALWYKETRKHGALVRQLGPDGMSSDEGEYENNILQRYRIHNMPWRDPRVTSLMRLLDALRRRYRSEQGQGDLRGSKCRLRCLSDAQSERTRAVPGLPRDAYEANWLQEQHALAVRDLEIQDGLYDFSVPGETIV
ncbi:hypothetical protein FKP32DRAFT_1613968 [Trametes sanguinea]|nr:hypothetical protein FKP32DRAFT_1613968 [Trametes sanguinea]